MADRAEPWLRGAIENVDPFTAPVLRSFEQAREDLRAALAGLTTEQLWTRPGGAASAGFHVRHIGGSIDRLLTYAEGRQLSEQQLASLKSEGEAGKTAEEMLEELEISLRKAELRVKAFQRQALTEPRAVGRKQLPTTVIGLLIHIAEHTQRHVGQAVTTAKIVAGAQ